MSSRPTLTSRIRPVEEAEDEPPQLGAAYRITGLINSGAQGTVYRAESPNGAEWAVKIPRLAGGGKPDDRQLDMFLQEAELSKQLLDTTHIIPVYQAGTEDGGQGRPYYVMEYFEGISLGEYIDRFSPVPPDRAIGSVVVRALAALSHAHARDPQVLHRDLKPGNILVRAEPNGFIHELKVIDFGLSLSQIGSFVGTPPYVAPELFRGETPTPASDIFSLGVIFLELLQSADEPPFYASSISEMRQRILHEEPDLEEVPAAVVPLLERMLHKQPEKRHATADRALEDCQRVFYRMRQAAVGAG